MGEDGNRVDGSGSNEDASDGTHSSRLSRRTMLQLAAAGITVPGAAAAASGATESFVDILSVDPTDYPNVLLNVSVDTVAGKDGRLTEEDFQIIENGVKKEIQSFSFASTKSDIVFVFDDTGSMSDEISGMKSQVSSLVDEIEAAGIDARYGLVTFKDNVETDLGLTDDASTLQSRVDELYASGGGDFPEDNFDAIERALGLGFRDDAQKILVDITDATSHYRGDGSGISEHVIDEVASDLTDSGVAYIAVSPGYEDPDAAKRVLAEKVDGRWIDIYDADFTVILEEITELLVTAYVVEYVTDLLPGETAPISVVVDDPERGEERVDDEVGVPSDVDGGISTELVQEKDSLIGEIQSLAGLTVGEDEARSSVDQRAATLLEDIRNDEFSASSVQYNEALERMVSSEEITRAATETVTGDDSPMESNLENLFSLIKGVAVELLSTATGGLLRSVVDSITRTTIGLFDDLLRSFSGRGVISDSTYRTVSGAIDSGTEQVYRQFRGWSRANPDQADEIAGNMRGQGLAAVADGATGLLQDLNDGRSVLSTIEELYFESYYHSPDWPDLEIPDPSQVELPDLEFTYDVPDEELPFPANQAVPDEISYSYGSPDIDLPAGLEELTDAIEQAGDVAGSGGINTTIDDQMDHLAENIGSLDRQDDGRRTEIAGGLTSGISGMSQVTETLIDLLEGLQGLLSEASEWVGYASIVAVGAAVVTSATAIGPVVSLGAAGTLASAAGALGIAALAIDGLQIATGQSYLGYLTDIHAVGTVTVTESPLGGGA